MSDISSDPRARGVSITIKYGKGYDESWAGFTGLASEVREDIIEFFGLDREGCAGMTLSEIVVNATQVAHGKGVVATTLGGTVIPSSAPAQPEAQPAAAEAGGDPWAGVEEQPAQPAENPLLAQIAACADVDALKVLWADNQAAFADPALMDAWKARGRELSS